MKRFQIIFLLSLLLGCSQVQKGDISGLFPGENASWIEDTRDLPAKDSLYYLDLPAPMFRKDFELGSGIQSARLFITAAGYYKSSINGAPVGKNILDPAWTDYSKRVFYTEYDVSSLLEEGSNCLGVELGNGFYNPLPLRKWGRRNLRKDLKVGKPAFIAKLLVEYENGDSEEICSDSTWSFSYGPILKNDVYLGVNYDARKEIKGWALPDFMDTDWQKAKLSEGPGGKLEKAFFPPVQVTRSVSPTDIYATEEGVYIVDMGINFTGTFRMKLSGQKGDSVVFRFGERVYEDGTLNPMTTVAGQIKRKGVGGPGAPEIAWQTDCYIFGDNSEVWFSPDFTYHTYRYMEVSGPDTEPRKDDIEGLFFHSNVAQDNHFSCSSELLNSIQEATKITFLANLVSVQSDCPAREKFGYGGDLNATSESFICNFDMQSFYRKTIYDWVDAMNDSVFVDTAPYTGIKYCGISWESAFLTTQYYLYLYYGDTAIIRELYEMDKEWMEKAARLHPEGIVKRGLSDHESMEPVPVELTGTCHYLQTARIMAKFAAVMDDPENQEKYGKLADKLKVLIRKEFWDQAVEGRINRQTLFSTLLYHDIVPKDEAGSAADSLAAAIANGPSGHLSTGIFGTKYALETYSEFVSPESVFKIVNSRDYPGWGHMIDKGATTIWETWKESDNTFSNCHPMFGSVTEWFYRWLGGIRPDPHNPGFRNIIIAPSTPQGLKFVNCTYNSPFGAIVSNWKQENTGVYVYDISIPEQSKASISLSLNEESEISIEKKSGKEDFVIPASLESGRFELREGEYIIRVSPGS